jgi:hypothetical protein
MTDFLFALYGSQTLVLKDGSRVLLAMTIMVMAVVLV